jgi:hypothetical protein
MKLVTLFRISNSDTHGETRMRAQTHSMLISKSVYSFSMQNINW